MDHILINNKIFKTVTFYKEDKDLSREEYLNKHFSELSKLHVEEIEIAIENYLEFLKEDCNNRKLLGKEKLEKAEFVIDDFEYAPEGTEETIMFKRGSLSLNGTKYPKIYLFKDIIYNNNVSQTEIVTREFLKHVLITGLYYC